MKPEQSKMNYVILTLEEYKVLVEENEKLKEYLQKAVDVIYDTSYLCCNNLDCKHCLNKHIPCDENTFFVWEYADRVKEFFK